MIATFLLAIAVWLCFPSTVVKKVSTTKKLNPNLVSLLVALAIWFLMPTGFGLILAICIGVGLPKVIAKLPTKQEQTQLRLIQHELDLTIDLLAASLAAGLSPLSALDAVSGVVDPKLGSELVAAANRLQWGAEVEYAFSGDFKPVGVALSRAMEHGVAAGTALAEIAARIRDQRKQKLLQRTKKLSVTLALPVALLMLPGFVLLGVVPMIVPALSSLW